MDKDFQNWNQLKINLNKSKRLPTFNEREIWWCSLGTNVGFEIDGKNAPFHRPVLVLKKFNRHTFLGIPLTTKIRNLPFHYHFKFKGKNQCAILSQIRLFDCKRIERKIGKIPLSQLYLLKCKIGDMIK